MKLMPALPETVFDIGYLLFSVAGGIYLLKKTNGRAFVRLFGAMTLILGLGDSFHLVPRVLNYWTQGDYTVALGVGKLVTSVTMTVFYLLMEYARRERYKFRGQNAATAAVWILSAARIALCCFPQNEWTSAEPSLLWGVIRNIPFVLLGILTVILWLSCAKSDKQLRLMWLAVTLSFLFYLPVVLFSRQLPLIGMLMLPKTCMYIWMIVMFMRAEKQ